MKFVFGKRFIEIFKWPIKSFCRGNFGGYGGYGKYISYKKIRIDFGIIRGF